MLSELVPSDTIKLVDENCFPEIFSLGKEQDAARIGQLIESRKPVILDTIEAQLEELFKLRQPSSGWSQSEFQLAVRSRLGEHPEAYGIWVYYSWRNALVHLLNEEEFREVRTNRNIAEDYQRGTSETRKGFNRNHRHVCWLRCNNGTCDGMHWG